MTKPITRRFTVAAWLGQRKWGRRLLSVLYPLSWGTSDDDWREVLASAQANQRFLRHYVYVAFVFRKPSQRSSSQANLAG